MTPTPPPGPFFVWVGRSNYANQRAGYPTVGAALQALDGIIAGRRLPSGLRLTVATHDGRVAWQRTL